MGECKSGIQNELKIAGTNLFLVSAGICGAVIVLAAAGGELLDLYPVSFEVIFPFFAAVSVGEWARTRADGNFDLIAAQSRSLFAWALKRSAAVFGTVSFFCRRLHGGGFPYPLCLSSKRTDFYVFSAGFFPVFSCCLGGT